MAEYTVSKVRSHIGKPLADARGSERSHDRKEWLWRDTSRTSYETQFLFAGALRVFFCALGHTPALFTSPAMVQHILAGVQFIVGDLTADTTPSAKLGTSAVR